MIDFWHKIENGVFIVAEIGKNFIQTEEDRPVSEYLDNAKALVLAAKKAGADAVKFQTHWVEDEVMPLQFDAPHFKGQDRYKWVLRNTEATPINDFWIPLASFCREQDILFFSTPMSRGAAQSLERVGVKLWKVGSADLLDFVLLDFLASTGKPIIISSGMSTLGEVDMAAEFLKKRNAKFALMQCVSKYPCPVEDLKLATIPFFRRRYEVPIGFSDHSLGIESAAEAAALGATILEKHFSFSRNLWGSDHGVSLNPAEFRLLCEKAHNVAVSSEKTVEQIKVLQDDEAIFRPVFRKSLMASCDIPAGSIITSKMLYAMRPQKLLGGLPSEQYESVLGRRASRALKRYDPIKADSFI